MTENLRNRLGKMVTITWEDGKTARVRAKWSCAITGAAHLTIWGDQIRRAAKRSGGVGKVSLSTVPGYKPWGGGPEFYFYADKIQE